MNQQVPVRHSLPTETINAILAYLDTRPHGEVRRLVDSIVQGVVPVDESSAVKQEAKD